ncbi:hypothetical protein [Paracidovorax konjaci]|uniref:Uncharacterized protein n=1 Tax=Paracidovorax konjaci TaxID=32040 RepID=A0A1I1WPJ3_9BURK|nr:hypothetical protein [Paracidovorax konjaci]SFD95343.1 hypothetical protein SAMN04489710_1102 [Paracidovorax konjaci]
MNVSRWSAPESLMGAGIRAPQMGQHEVARWQIQQGDLEPKLYVQDIPDSLESFESQFSDSGTTSSIQWLG